MRLCFLHRVVELPGVPYNQDCGVAGSTIQSGLWSCREYHTIRIVELPGVPYNQDCGVAGSTIQSGLWSCREYHTIRIVELPGVPYNQDCGVAGSTIQSGLSGLSCREYHTIRIVELPESRTLRRSRNRFLGLVKLDSGVGVDTVFGDSAYS